MRFHSSSFWTGSGARGVKVIAAWCCDKEPRASGRGSRKSCRRPPVPVGFSPTTLLGDTQQRRRYLKEELVELRRRRRGQIQSRLAGGIVIWVRIGSVVGSRVRVGPGRRVI